MIKCPKCKVDVLDEEARFCIECGAALNVNSNQNDLQENSTSEQKINTVKENGASLNVDSNQNDLQENSTSEQKINTVKESGEEMKFKSNKNNLQENQPLKKKSTIFLSRKPKIPVLKSGQSLNLTKLISEDLPLFVNISWNCKKKFTLDFTAFLTNSKGIIADDDDVIFYNNPIHPTECVELVEDVENAKYFNIDLPKIPEDVFKISFVFSIDNEDAEQYFDEFSADGEENEQTFKFVDSICVTVYNEDKKILEYNLENVYSDASALIVGELYQRDDVLIFRALDEKFADGLAEVCEKFGLEVQ